MPYGTGGRYGGGSGSPNYGSFRPTGAGSNNAPGVGQGGWDKGGGYISPDQYWSQINDPKTAGHGQTWFNSATGETYYDSNMDPNRPAGNKSNDQRGKFWWMDNMSGAMKRPEFINWEGGGYETPAGWVAPETDIPEAGVDIRAIVESRRHMLDEEMSGQMSDSARRLGAGGMLAGSEYVNELGQAERSRDKDLAALYYDFDFRAAQEDANRRSTSRERMLDRDLDAWGTHGGWEQEGNLRGSDQDFSAWMAENQWNDDGYDDQMAWLQMMLPMLMAGGGGNVDWGAWN